MNKNVEMEIAMMQEEMLLGEENLETSDECDEIFEKDKSHGKRRKETFKSKNKKMEIGKRKKGERKSKETGKCGITPSKNGTHYTHEAPDKKVKKKISQKKVRNTEEVGKGNAYKKLYDVNK